MTILLYQFADSIDKFCATIEFGQPSSNSSLCNRQPRLNMIKPMIYYDFIWYFIPKNRNKLTDALLLRESTLKVVAQNVPQLNCIFLPDMTYSTY